VNVLGCLVFGIIIGAARQRFVLGHRSVHSFSSASWAGSRPSRRSRTRRSRFGMASLFEPSPTRAVS
jgi:hypothetical protein